MARRSFSKEKSAFVASANSVPAGAPAWVTEELIEQTIRVWQPYYPDPLTTDDAVAIIQGVGRLIDVLSKGSPP